MITFFRLIRIKQWIKNGFILIPLIFAGKFLDTASWQQTLFTFFSFSLITSGAYIFNDIMDRRKDTIHPQKSLRPIAAGEVSLPYAWSLAVVFLASGLSFLYSQKIEMLYLALFYILLQLIYNFFTRNHVILDVLTVAFGFQVRIWIGAAAIMVIPSSWLQMCVLVLALFLGFTKRRYEIDNLKEKAPEHRNALKEYTIHFLDQLIIISSTLSVVFYGLYTISSDITARLHGNELLYSICFVIYGMFRYLYLLHVKKLGDDPGEVLLKDKPLLITLVLWVVFIVITLVMAKGL
ncbi:MAG: decaprenyl-phosphate phosphoribosyltransferase [Candidatus Omnitrophota bacterium]